MAPFQSNGKAQVKSDPRPACVSFYCASSNHCRTIVLFAPRRHDFRIMRRTASRPVATLRSYIKHSVPLDTNQCQRLSETDRYLLISNACRLLYYHFPSGLCCNITDHGCKDTANGVTTSHVSLNRHRSVPKCEPFIGSGVFRDP